LGMSAKSQTDWKSRKKLSLSKPGEGRKGEREKREEGGEKFKAPWKRSGGLTDSEIDPKPQAKGGGRMKGEKNKSAGKNGWVVVWDLTTKEFERKGKKKKSG